MFAVSVSAQTIITEFEYFIDQGAEFGEAISVDVADNATQNQSFNIPFTNLSPGIHTVFMRCKNNLGLWSHTVSRVFLVQENQPASAVTVIEYSIDQMPYFGEANTIVLTEPSSDVNFAIEISPSELENLSEGPHVVYVRVKDNNDEWSHTNSIVFIKVDPLNAPIVGAEFFIGEDPGIGMAEAQGDYMAFAQPAMQGVFPLTIPPNLLIDGFNLVGMRTKNSNGEWSHTRFFEVIVQIEEFVTGTIQSSSETVCYNTIPNAISVTAAAEAINGDISYQWYSRGGIHTASGALSSWNILDGETGTTLSFNQGLTSTTTYACYVTTANGAAWMLGQAQITVLDPPTLGALVLADEVLTAPANPALISFITAPAGSTNFTYQWYSFNSLTAQVPTDCSTDGWQLIPGATSSSYNPLTGVNQDITYACFVTPTGANTCSTPCWAQNTRQIDVSTVSVDEVGANVISIYPNPCADVLYVDIAETANCTIRIFDITGKTLEQFNSNSFTTTINMAKYAIGTYLVEIKSNSNIIQKHVIKN